MGWTNGMEIHLQDGFLFSFVHSSVPKTSARTKIPMGGCLLGLAHQTSKGGRLLMSMLMLQPSDFIY